MYIIKQQGKSDGATSLIIFDFLRYGGCNIMQSLIGAPPPISTLRCSVGRIFNNFFVPDAISEYSREN